MDLTIINKMLGDLESLRHSYKPVETIVDSSYGQGEEGVKHEVYSVEDSDVLLRITTTVNSYGNNERITGVQFVKPATKLINSYEPI